VAARSAIVATAAVVALAGCGGAGAANSAASATGTVHVTDAERVAIKTLQGSGTRLGSWSDAELVDGMKSACDQLRQHGMATAIAGLRAAARTDEDLEVGALLILDGVLAECPEFYDDLPQLNGLPGIAG
jgi:hypothetical protein